MARRGNRHSKKRSRRSGSSAARRTASTLPPQLQPLVAQAEQLRAAGRNALAVPIYQKIIKQAPDYPPTHMALAECLIKLNHFDDGIKAARLACNLAPNDLTFKTNLAEFLLFIGRAEDAKSRSRSILKLEPANHRAALILAQALEKLHQYDDALEVTNNLLTQSPGEHFARILNARLLRRTRNYKQAVSNLRNFRTDPSIPPHLRQFATHELAMSLDQLAEYDEAFRTFTEYGRLAASSPAFKSLDKTTWPREISAYESRISPQFLDACRTKLKVEDHLSSLVFLVGFPRSGTTMTEQILAAHPKIITTDEKPFLNAVKSEIIRNAGKPEPIADLFQTITPRLITKLRKTYWDQVISQVGPVHPTQTFIDKLPLNIIDLPLINIIFPDSKIIVALRDPRDVCISCFMQDFGLNEAMIHFLTLEGTASFYAKVMGFYLQSRSALSLERLQIRYEDTVADLESQARYILSYLNLDWNENLLRFHELAKARAISTPSFAAVTEPVHNRAVHRWKNYQSHFTSLLPILQPFITEFGYDEN